MKEQVTFSNITFAYEFILRNGERLSGATTGISIGPEKSQPTFPGSQITCDLESVFTLITTNEGVNPKIFWADNLFGPNGNIALLSDDQEGIPRDIALIQAHEGDIWIARSEPTLDNRLAITIANAKDKVLLIGMGDVIEVDLTPMRPDLPPKKGYQLVATLQESYKWKRASPKGCAHCHGSVRQTSPSTNPDYSAPDGGTCFTAGTPVMLSEIEIKPIDKLRIGDIVLTRDEKTGAISSRPIRHVWIHNAQSTLLVQLANGEQIETTPKHQFAVSGGGFTAAGGLDLGNTLITHDNANVQVTKITSRSEPAIVFNLEVDDYHTYFVGETGVWVHNMRKE